MKRPKFLIIDGHAIAYRCYFSPMPSLNGPNGEPTKATYGFMRVFVKMVEMFQPDYLALAMDGKRSLCWRREVYPKYKANRKSRPEDLGIQLQRITQIMRKLGVPILRHENFEADDVIATLCESLVGIPLTAIIATRDKDLHQLLRENPEGCHGETVRLFDPFESLWMKFWDAEKRWGVPPCMVGDILSLAGDTSDNIPGVAKVGEETAKKLVKEYGTIRSILKAIKNGEDDIKPSIREAIMKAEEDGTLAMSQKLVGLRYDVPLDYPEAGFEWPGLDLSKARMIFRALGFKKYLA